MATPLLAKQLDLDAGAFALSYRAAKRPNQGLDLREGDGR